MTIKIGILGLGTVGGGVVKILQKRQKELSQFLGKSFEITSVMSRRDYRLSELGLSKDIYTDNFDDFLKQDLDIIVEAIGGEAPADVIKQSLKKGIAVVTANKALLAKEGSNILGIEGSENLYYEASCCGGIPIVSTFEEGLLANNVQSLMGIFNGTCNYILTEMSQKGSAFSDVLVEAQKLGYAEADPTFDVEGIDASHKLCLLCSLAFRKQVDFNCIKSEGITKLTPDDFLWAKNNNYTIKLISMGKLDADDNLYVGTSPMLISSTHPLANVNGANNAVFIDGDAVGELVFSGAGAGEMPTASAVVSDIIAAAQHKTRLWSHSVFSEASVVKNSSPLPFSFYIRLKTRDEVGVLAKLCEEFAQSNISLKFVHQNESKDSIAEIVFTTHPQTVDCVQSALQKMQTMGLVTDEPLVLKML